MARMKIKLDPNGIEEIWKILEPQLQSAADAIASGLPTNSNPGTLARRDRNNRPVVLVAMRVPKGLAIQAKTGALTRAAASIGLDVHRYSGG